MTLAVQQIISQANQDNSKKEAQAFRDYTAENELHDRVYKTYNDMHTNQTYDYVKKQHEKWLNFDHEKLTIMQAIDLLSDFVDESDPDVDFANRYHAYQTAEGVRKVHPDKEWLIFTAFIHDLGKMMGMKGQPQWSTVGDTFVVGCKPAKSIVFSETTFLNNPDTKNPKYNTELGIYTRNCGLNKLTMSWGHDEYLYQVLKHNNCKIPIEGLYAIRFHSFYPWHTGNDYTYFEDQQDREMKKWVLEFNKFDLYTKSVDLPDIDKLRPYYESLAQKFMPGVLDW